MKFIVPAVAMLALGGCSVEKSLYVPSDPETPPATASTSLWAMVIDESGGCIEGATIQEVGGQSQGTEITQATPCDAWAYDGGVVFKDLVPGVEMTLRARAPGYLDQERIVVPHRGSQMAVLFWPPAVATGSPDD